MVRHFVKIVEELHFQMMYEMIARLIWKRLEKYEEDNEVSEY